jgi:uncharacterized Tic20 family protein
MNQDTPANPPPPSSLPPTQPTAPPAPVMLSETEARTWAMVAHLTVLLNLVTGFLGVVAALVIYLVFKDRSRYVAYQSLQAFVFQLIFWAGGGLAIGIIWAITGTLSTILIGILCVPFALVLTVALGLMPLVALVYGVYGGLEANQGKPFSYWLIGGWVRNIVPA